MRSISSQNQAALAARQLVARDFLTITARDRVTAVQVTVGFWSGLGETSAQVLNPDTGAAQTRSFHGAGSLIAIDAIPAVAQISVQRINIQMSQLDDQVAEAVRLYDVKQGRVEIHRGLFSPDTRALVAPAFCRFVGFVDTIEIRTPAEGGEGGVALSCVSHTQELTRSNPDVRSNNSQKQRNAGDAFFLDVGIAGQREIQWGENTSAAADTSSGHGGGILPRR